MKLLLKHLAPYLPYKLKVSYLDRIIVMNAGPGSSNNWIGITAVLQRQNKCKPILRPLSNLTKEIEVNGEKFIPIEKLASIERGEYENGTFKEYEIKKEEIGSRSGSKFNYYFVRYKYPNRIFEFGFNHTSFFRMMYPDIDMYVDNQYLLFQKLLEWHFDIFNLIDNKLAIDINTL